VLPLLHERKWHNELAHDQESVSKVLTSVAPLYFGLQRPRDVVVRAQNEKGEPVTLNLGGSDSNAAWIARIFQHEYDHLQVSA